VPPLVVQSWQDDPFAPHWLSVATATHDSPLQHPVHVCALHAEPVSAAPPSLPPFPELPPLLDPLGLPLVPPLLLPLEEELLDPSRVPRPESYEWSPMPASGEMTAASSPVWNAPTSEFPAAHAGTKGRAKRQGSATTPNPVLRMARSVPLRCFQTTRIPSLFQCESDS
jgi:hypothetical protein